MKRRILTALLAVCLVFALGTIGAYADDPTPITAESSELESGEYVLNSNVTLTDPLTIKNGVTVTLTLNPNCTLTNAAGQDTIVVEYGGTLTIKGSGTVDNISNARAAIYNSGTVTIDGGTYDRSQETGKNANEGGDNTFYVILNHGIMTINNATITQKGHFSSMIENGYQNYGSRDARTGYIQDTNHPNPSLTINGGSFDGGLNTVKNDDGGVARITNGLFTNTSQAAVLNWNDATISGGSFTAAQNASTVLLNGYSNQTVDTGKLTVTGGIFNASTNGNTVQTMNNGSSGIGAVAISGGTFNGDINVIAGERQNNSNSVSISGTAVINGDVINTTTTTVTIKDGAEVTGTVSNTGTGKVSVTNATIGSIAEGSIVYTNNAIITDGTTGTEAVASVNGELFATLQDAIDAAGTGDTVNLLDDIEVDGSTVQNTHGVITIDAKNITINGNGNKIKIIGITDNTPSAINIQNGANVNVNNLVIDSNGARHGLNIYNATVKVSGVEIMNSDWYAVVCNSSDLTVDSLYTHGNQWGINIDSKVAGEKSNVTINNAQITESDSIVFEDYIAAGTTTTINNGSFKNIKEKGDNTEGIEVNVTGGTFTMDVRTVADTHPNYQVQSGSYYTYYNDIDAALAAAAPTDTITYVGAATTTYKVTFKLSNTSSYTVTVPAGTEITLPRESYGSYYLAGWKCGGVTYGVGDKVKVNGTMTFDAIWKNGQYDIVIDATMKHGDIYTNVSSADAGEYVYITVDPDLGYKLKSLTVYVSLNNKVTVYKTSALSQYDYYFIMPGATVFVTATFEADGMPFVDVRPYQWHYDAVYYVWSNGLMQGLSDYIFEPDGDMTRAMFWAVLGRIDGEDITGIDWVSEARSWAMTNGVSDGTDPNGKITREQMVTMLWRFLDKPTGTAYMSIYSDANTISSWAKDAMVWAIDEGIIEGITSTTIVPRGTATRAQCATIFMRAEID